MLLYRPVGLEELRLIYEADMRAFPRRLPEQPIFYPVTNEEYAKQIARGWNTKSGTLAGFVTRFSVDDAYVSRFERRVVGRREHEELWVPAEDLSDFNAHIGGHIEVVAAYFGEGFQGYVPERFGLKGKGVEAQFTALARTLPYSRFDFSCEIAANDTAIFLGFLFWEQHDFANDGFDVVARDKVLTEMKKHWSLAAGSPRRSASSGDREELHGPPRPTSGDQVRGRRGRGVRGAWG